MAIANSSLIAVNLFFGKIKEYIARIIKYLMRIKAVQAIGSILNMSAIERTNQFLMLAYNEMYAHVVNDSQLFFNSTNGQPFTFEFITSQNGTFQIVTAVNEICINLINNSKKDTFAQQYKEKKAYGEYLDLVIKSINSFNSSNTDKTVY